MQICKTSAKAMGDIVLGPFSATKYLLEIPPYLLATVSVVVDPFQTHIKKLRMYILNYSPTDPRSIDPQAAAHSRCIPDNNTPIPPTPTPPRSNRAQTELYPSQQVYKTTNPIPSAQVQLKRRRRKGALQLGYPPPSYNLAGRKGRGNNLLVGDSSLHCWSSVSRGGWQWRS